MRIGHETGPNARGERRNEKKGYLLDPEFTQDQ